MNKVRFTKMHGIGNDYVYFTEMPCPPCQLADLSRRLSDRHTGVGGDGIILVLPSDVADFSMRIFNADGSEAKMCGNGSRCVGKLVYDSGLTPKTELTLETGAGVKRLSLHLGADGAVESVTVDMGLGLASEPVDLDSCGGVRRAVPVDMGNPHGVVFLDHAPTDFDVLTVGRELETNPFWPDRANIEMARVLGNALIEMRVWERGSGETMACGTGACATAVAAHSLGLCGPKVKVGLPGGFLDIELMDDGRVLMTGPATTVFSGEVLI